VADDGGRLSGEPQQGRHGRRQRTFPALGSTPMTNDDQGSASTPTTGSGRDEARRPARGRDSAQTQPVRSQRAADRQSAAQAAQAGTEDGAGLDLDFPLWSGDDGDGMTGSDRRSRLRDGGEPEEDLEDSGEPEDEDEEEEDQPPRKGKARKGSFWRELPLLVVIAVVIALLVKTYVVQMFFIPSGSMQDTLQINDRIMVNKLVYHFRPIEPGDIVVFNDDGSWNPEPPQAPPSSDPVVRAYDATVVRLYHSLLGMVDGSTQDNGNIIVKRVIGVPGDHVACCNANGDLTVNGVALNESSYLFPGNSPGSAPTQQAGHFSITVPAGRLWVMGDHRAISDDSRMHTQDPFGGTIPENAVIGRAFVIIWPPSRWRFLPIPSTFNQPGVDGAKTASAAGQAVPYLPLGAGFVAAVPLTLMQRRMRLKVRRRGIRTMGRRGSRGPRAGLPRPRSRRR
jgi:signal peptidase I